MANSKSAEKRIKQTEVCRDRNRGDRSKMRTAVKRLRAAVVEGDSARANDLLPGTLSLIDVSARKRIIHRNAAARYKARLTYAVRKLEVSA